MPGIQHDTANSLVREHPELVIRLLRTVGGFQLPESAQVRVVDGELNDRPSNDLHADTVIMGGPVHDPWFTVASEIETRLTPVKFEQALRYAVALWLRLRKPVYVLFITSDPQARKFAVPVTAEAGGLTLILCPCVCGPDEIPALTDPAQVADDPAMAALSVMAHGDEPGVSEAFLTGLNGLDPDDAPRYHEYAYRMAAVPVRRILEALMATTTWPV